jgi:dipeptidyl aminopeptidase/acylaminoacyl peptidase
MARVTRLFGLLFCVFVVASCAPSVTELPTVAILPTAAITSAPPIVARTLPPTWTPTVSAVPSATPLPITPTTPPSNGTLFYIFNQDSIAAQPSNGNPAVQPLVILGGAPNDLALSPDGQLIAFVADAGNAREIYVVNQDGTYRQQISCLGYAITAEPTWSPDGESIAFYAAPSAIAPLNIYTANVDGSGNCPADNNQRLAALIDATNARGLAWNTTSDVLFFHNNNVTFRIALDDPEATPVQAFYNSNKPEYEMAYNYGQNSLYFLRGISGTDGELYNIEEQVMDPNVDPNVFLPIGLRSFAFSNDGNAIVWQAGGGLFMRTFDPAGSFEVVRSGITDVYAWPVISPDNRQVAFINSINNAQQIFVVDRTGDNRVQITQNVTGTITDLLWAP